MKLQYQCYANITEMLTQLRHLGSLILQSGQCTGMFNILWLIFNRNIWPKCSRSAPLQGKLVLGLVTEICDESDRKCVVISD